MKYPKINTLWKRDENNKFNIIEGDFSCEEFASIKRWYITEKIDGTNIRIIWDLSFSKNSQFKGKTDDAEIPKFLLDYLEKNFSYSLFEKQFPEAKKVMLFGEGYGNKIQSAGKKYREDNSFILFDAWIDGFWLEPAKVKQLANELGIDYVPELGIFSTEEAIAYLKERHKSKASQEELIAEGIVARSHPLMLFRKTGEPIMWKLKVKDYERLVAR